MALPPSPSVPQASRGERSEQQRSLPGSPSTPRILSVPHYSRLYGVQECHLSSIDAESTFRHHSPHYEASRFQHPHTFWPSGTETAHRVGPLSREPRGACRFASDVHCGYRERRPKRFTQEHRQAGPGARCVNPGSLHNSFGRRAAVKNVRSEILINAGGLDSRKVRLALSNRVVWPFQPLMPIVYARIFQKRAILIQSAQLECWPI